MAHGPAAELARSPDDEDHHRDGDQGQTQVMPVAVEKAAPALRVRSKRSTGPRKRSAGPR